jgi:glycosyltransferase involved in cell wall biosynthesis
VLTVVIPIYNEEHTIGGCLDAVLAQREPVDEIVVVDNNSTDGTRRVLASYADKVVVVDQARQGVQHARSAGMDAASGAVIGRIDADTRLPPDWSRTVRAAFRDPSVQALTGPATYYDIALGPLIGWGDAAIRRAWAAGPMDWLFGANMAIRATAWRAVRPSLCTTPEVHEDLDLGIHLHTAGLRIAYEPTLRAGTSARRIANRFGAYRRYLRMSEVAYRRHGRPATRARLTTGILILLFPFLRLLYVLRHGRGRPGTPVRKNPMSEVA